MLDYFTTTIQKQRQRKYQKLTKDAGEATQESRRTSDGSWQNVIDPSKMEAAVANAIEQDMDTFSSQEALDYERAYYKVCNL
jgi:hypothetical protein